MGVAAGEDLAEGGEVLGVVDRRVVDSRRGPDDGEQDNEAANGRQPAPAVRSCCCSSSV
jgi:hypothetical protein